MFHANVNRNAMRSSIFRAQIFSPSLRRDMDIDIYLPATYHPDQKFPVLYMLHGHGGTQESWFDLLFIHLIADKLIRQRKIGPLILVAPSYDNSFGVNALPASRQTYGVDAGTYEDYLIREVTEFVDSQYSTVSTRDGRYISGISMGGYAALYLAFTHSDMFSKVAASSSYLPLGDDNDLFWNQRDWLYPNEEVRKTRDPLYLCQRIPVEEFAVYLDCGRRDPLAPGTNKLIDSLNKRGVSVQWRNGRGGHTLSYWRRNIKHHLLFFAGQNELRTQ